MIWYQNIRTNRKVQNNSKIKTSCKWNGCRGIFWSKKPIDDEGKINNLVRLFNRQFSRDL
jgi:uncharacterized protein with ParB-like and HNH nuclease domain